jgi:hypothetical protein
MAAATRRRSANSGVKRGELFGSLGGSAQKRAEVRGDLEVQADHAAASDIRYMICWSSFGLINRMYQLGDHRRWRCPKSAETCSAAAQMTFAGDSAELTQARCPGPALRGLVTDRVLSDTSCVHHINLLPTVVPRRGNHDPARFTHGSTHVLPRPLGRRRSVKLAETQMARSR